MAQEFTDDCFAGSHAGQTDLQNMENNFAALKSQFSGASAPSNPVAGMPWIDTANNLFKIRNAANTAWISLFNISNSTLVAALASGLVTLDMCAAALKGPAAGTYGLRKLGTGATEACAGNDSRLTANALQNKQVFTSSGTFTVPSGVTYVEVVAVGGGGGGGGGSKGVDYFGGSGGGSGEVIARVCDVSGLGTVTCTIGAAGTGGAIDADGTAGGNTTFGALLTAHGGAKGVNVSSGVAQGGAGGVKTLISTDTDILFSFAGESGGNGGMYRNAGMEGWIYNEVSEKFEYQYFSAGRGGYGGSPAMGYGTGGSGENSAGAAGTGYGAGGQGGTATTSNEYAGGNGTAGVIIVRY